MNSENSKTSDSHSLLFNILDKINLKKNDKYAALSNFSIYYILKNIKKSCKNNKCRVSAQEYMTWEASVHFVLKRSHTKSQRNIHEDTSYTKFEIYQVFIHIFLS